MERRTKGEQKAYLDGFEMCADCIEKYLTKEGKRRLECLLASVRNAVEIENIETHESEKRKKGKWEYGYSFPDGNYCKCTACNEIIKCTYPMHFCPRCGAKMETEE